MADTLMVDEFDFPLTTGQRLFLMQGGRLSESDKGYVPNLPSRGNDLNEVGDLGFTRQDWLDAHFELYCFNLRAGMRPWEASASARESEGA